ncbi:YiiX/YebB-like N1pC/P60 family cysteine hydrolase [Brevibacillus dissolubilis]|uniref:YiiX/YebB-like N1pC/P60 family cysteine hydrolase n=1 Tax=Brevibacillus dissolubilis TaxID=1844116 RepID=UPI0021000FB2|nr:YiiX/YebB-like N1pC/P60 family cysteine hydrolase [Brevibacillus dissolubilis]
MSMYHAKFQNLTAVSYSQARPKLRTGDILFCSGDYVISDMIKHFSGSDFSHVGMVFHWNQRTLLLESVEDDGVRIVPLSHYIYDYENSKRPYQGQLYIGRHSLFSQVDESTINHMLGYGTDRLNRCYDRQELIKIAARISMGTGRHDPNEAYICSELLDELFQQAGISVIRDERSFIFPGHFAEDPHVEALFQIIP